MPTSVGIRSQGGSGGGSGGGGSGSTWTTFTPTLTLVGGSGNTVPQYTTNKGRYTTIGKTIFVLVELSGDGGNEGAGSGQVNIALPVAAGANAGDLGNPIPVGYAFNIPSEYEIYGSIDNSSTTISLTYPVAVNTGSFSAFHGSDQSNSGRGISLKFFYEID